MDYEKKYKEALKRARIWQNHLYDTNDKDYANELNYIFPELAESGDEKIRKQILSFLKEFEYDHYRNLDFSAWIAWLEKQGEKDVRQKFLEDLLVADDIYQMSMNEAMVEEARTKVINALSELEISKLLGIEKQGDKDSQVKLPTFTFDDILALQCCMETAKKVQNDKDLYEKLNDLHGRIYDAYYLEKQGEQNPYSGVSFKYNSHTWGMCARDGGVEILVDGEIKERVFLDNKPQDKYAQEATKEEKVDNQNCVKSVYNDEPKFKAGDWIVFTNGNVERIISVGTHGYTFDDGDYLLHDECDKIAHLWSIQDAKDGDVLVSRSPFIYGKQCPYGGLNWCNNKFIKASNFIFTDSPVHPATKEQRDFLFQKMKEAGYTFDFEKKELKKLGQSEVTKISDQEEIAEIPFGAKDSELQEATYFIPKGFHAKIDDDKVVIKKGEKPAAWSEEDERNMQNIDSVLFYDKTLPEDTCVKLRNFLKTLKERIGWKPSEEQISSLRSVVNSLPHEQVLFTLYNDLRKLKGE